MTPNAIHTLVHGGAKTNLYMSHWEKALDKDLENIDSERKVEVPRTVNQSEDDLVGQQQRSYCLRLIKTP